MPARTMNSRKIYFERFGFVNHVFRVDERMHKFNTDVRRDDGKFMLKRSGLVKEVRSG